MQEKFIFYFNQILEEYRDMAAEELKALIEEEHKKFQAAKDEVAKIIVNQKEVIDRLFIALLADGHVIIEGLPGLAKTLVVNTLAKVIQCEFKRIQFTPDLLPADLIGTQVYNPKEGTFSINKGPIFTNILMADEINRAPAKVQSALLEVMQERQVTISGTTFKTGKPYLVMATQNPIEHEGVYPLPEAQTDRFMMKVKIDYPSRDEEKEIIERMAILGKKPEVQPVLSTQNILDARKVVDQIYIDEKVTDYYLDIVQATRKPKEYGVDIEGLLLYGASPRATMAFKLAAKAHAFLAGRPYVTPHDIKQIGPDILRHRLRRTYEAEAEEIMPDDIISRIFDTIPVP